MKVLGIRWLGVGTDRVAEMRAFATEVLGLTVAGEGADDFVVLTMADGSKLELFGSAAAADRTWLFAANPVVAGFLVDDIESARAELERAPGVELLGLLRVQADGYAWQHFRAPDGHVYELTVDPAAARPQAPARSVLIVAYRTAATPLLLAQVRRRAAEGPCRFTLLVPRPLWDADTEESAITLELAIPLLDAAAGSHVRGLVGESDPFGAVSSALAAGDYDEVIISTLPARVSHWLHIDLPARVQRLGLPVTVVTATRSERSLT